MKDARFVETIRFHKEKAMPHVAYVTDTATGMKFSNSFDTKEQAERWIDWAKGLLTKGRNN